MATVSHLHTVHVLSCFKEVTAVLEQWQNKDYDRQNVLQEEV